MQSWYGWETEPNKEDLTYDYLRDMPGILILVDKCQLGDTLPMDCTDMRLRGRGQKAYSLANIRQLLARNAGRRKGEEAVPSLLVPASLYEMLKECYVEHGDLVHHRGFKYDTSRLLSDSSGPNMMNYHFDFYEKILSLPVVMGKQSGADVAKVVEAPRKRKRSTDLKTLKELDADARPDVLECSAKTFVGVKPLSEIWGKYNLECRACGNGMLKISGLKQLRRRFEQQVHPRRALFIAQEQGGKTGVFLSAIEQLQRKFDKRQPRRVKEVKRTRGKVDWAAWDGWDNGQIWKWLDVDNLSGELKKKVIVDGREIELKSLVEPGGSPPQKPRESTNETQLDTVEVGDTIFVYGAPGECCARNFAETDESQLLHLPGPKLGHLELAACSGASTVEKLVISVPGSNTFISVDENRVVQKTNKDPNKVKNWVFTPSFDRSHKQRALLNWWDMSSPTTPHQPLEEHLKDVFHLIVVGPGGRTNPNKVAMVKDGGREFEVGDEFDAYRKLWGHTHGVVQLPAGSKSKGYACSYIFRIAQHLKLSRVWIVPDVIACFYKTIPKRTDKEFKWDPTPAPVVLQALESQYHQSVNDLGGQSKARCAILGIHACKQETGLVKLEPRQPFVRESPQVFLLNADLLSGFAKCTYDCEAKHDKWQHGQDMFAFLCSSQKDSSSQKSLMVVQHCTYVSEQASMPGGHHSLVSGKPELGAVNLKLLPSSAQSDLVIRGGG